MTMERFNKDLKLTPGVTILTCPDAGAKVCVPVDEVEIVIERVNTNEPDGEPELAGGTDIYMKSRAVIRVNECLADVLNALNWADEIPE